MYKARILYFLCAVIATFAVVIGVIKNKAPLLEQITGEARVNKADNKDIIRLLQDARVVAFNSWPVEEGERKNLSYSAQSFDRDPNYDGAGVKLSVFDQVGTVIYEDYFSEVHRIYSSYALRKGSPQLVMEVGYGGSTSFLIILDYQKSKIVNLMESVEPNSDFTSGAEIRPQFRSGINPAVEPYEVLLTEGVGLASPAKKHTKVFRYKEGAYRYIGEFPQQKVDDYIEELLRHPESQPNTKK